MPDRMTSLMAFPASSRVSKAAEQAAAFSGFGLILRIISVTTPRVPSEPTNNRVKSYPDTHFIQLEPVRRISPSGRTTSSPST